MDSASCSTARPGAPIRIGVPSSATMRPRSRRSTCGRFAFLEELRAHWETLRRALCDQRRDRSARRRLQGRQHGWLTKPRPIIAAQIAAFAEGGADMVTAYTLNSVNEAIGVVRAAKTHADPGCDLVHGGNQRPPGEGRDAAGGDRNRGSRRPTVRLRIFPDQLRSSDAFRECPRRRARPWTERIHGVRANASAKSHAELDESEALDSGRSRPISGGVMWRSGGAFPRMRTARRLLRHRSQARQQRSAMPACRVRRSARAPERQTKMAGIAPGHFHLMTARLSAAARCRAGAAAARPGRR